MLKFFSDAFKEIEHVVWPTPKETRTYMNYTIAIIVVMTIFLAVFGYVFRTSLQETKKVINPQSILTTIEEAQGEIPEELSAEQEAMLNEALNNQYEAFNLQRDETTDATSTSSEEISTEDIQPMETENADTIILPSEIEETEAESQAQ